ncbi:MAG: hypothetical protein IKD61_06905 [Oscillospiraceae bacterium]|nr:hypothetical protein [Oscillospiraceae bacterium]
MNHLLLPKAVVRELDALFSRAHVPLWEPKLGTHYKTLPTVFPTRKSAHGMVFARLPLMRHGLMHIDTDPDVDAVAGYPVQTVYWSASASAETGEVKRVHLPDLVIRRRDGSVVFIDYVPLSIQAERPWQNRQIAELRAHYRGEYGAGFAVHDERCVYGEPIWSNVSLMWGYKPTPADVPQMAAARHAIMRAPLPMSITRLEEEIRRGVAMPEDLYARAADLAFTAAMQLVIEGLADIDLSKPITPNSIITERKASAP